MQRSEDVTQAYKASATNGKHSRTHSDADIIAYVCVMEAVASRLPLFRHLQISSMNSLAKRSISVSAHVCVCVSAPTIHQFHLYANKTPVSVIIPLFS